MSFVRQRAPHLLLGALIVVFLGALLGTCRDPEARSLPAPSSTSSTAPTSTTSMPDFSRVALPAIDGATTTTGPATKGSATLRGTVQGPDGPVPGAIVRAERLVDDIVQPFEVRTGADGTFTLARVPGGRYRVRAFLPPTLVMGDPQVFFQSSFEERELRLVLEPFTGVVVTGDTAPGQPVVGFPVNLAVRVAERQVGEDGIAREVPLAGVLVRVNSTGWTALDDGATLVTDGDGIAVFRFECDRVGAVTATAVVGDDTPPPPPPDGGPAPAPTAPSGAYPLDVPGCAPRPTTTTTTTTTTEPSRGNPNRPTSTTTTTEP